MLVPKVLSALELLRLLPKKNRVCHGVLHPLLQLKRLPILVPCPTPFFYIIRSECIIRTACFARNILKGKSHMKVLATNQFGVEQCDPSCFVRRRVVTKSFDTMYARVSASVKHLRDFNNTHIPTRRSKPSCFSFFPLSLPFFPAPFSR